MKRRAAAGLMGLLLLVSLLNIPSSAADTVYFTAVNETVLELSDATMPFWSQGYLYVAGTMFATGELGLSYSYSNNKQKAVVYNTNTPSRALVFSLAEDIVSDSDTNNYYPPAVLRSGVVFLPVSLVTTYFGLAYTRVQVAHGYLIRVRSSASALPDSVFLELATSQLTNRYNQYQKRNEQSTATQGPATAPVTPSAPQTTPSTGETPEPEVDTPEVEGKTIALCFQITDNQQTAAILNTLNQYDGYATFYLTEGQIVQSEDLLRQLTAKGQTIGLIADASASTGVSVQLDRANEALFAATGSKTRFAYVAVAGSGDAQEATAAGYCCLSPNLNRAAQGLRSADNATYLLGRISEQRGDVVTVWLRDNVTEEALAALASQAMRGENALQGVRENET